MKWFKFYGQDFLTDSKIGSLNPLQKLMWVVLLSVASQDEEKTGIIKFLTESRLKELCGITDNPYNDDWLRTNETLVTFCNMGLVTMPDKDTIIINNYNEHQTENQSSAERVRAYRDRQKAKIEAKTNVTPVTNVTLQKVKTVTLDKNRIDKNNKEINKENKPSSKITYLIELPLEDVDEFTKNFVINKSRLISKGKEVYDSLISRGKTHTYTDYKALMRNILRRDFGERKIQLQTADNIPNVAPIVPPTPEELARTERIKSEMREKWGKKHPTEGGQANVIR